MAGRSAGTGPTRWNCNARRARMINAMTRTRFSRSDTLASPMMPAPRRSAAVPRVTRARGVAPMIAAGISKRAQPKISKDLKITHQDDSHGVLADTARTKNPQHQGGEAEVDSFVQE